MKEKTKKALELSGNAAAVGALAADLGPTGGAIAGGKLLWTAVTAGAGRRRRRQAEDFLQRVATALGEQDAARLAAELDPDGVSAAWDLIEEGFRTMMGSIHEDARRAISVLIADYAVLQSQVPCEPCTRLGPRHILYEHSAFRTVDTADIVAQVYTHAAEVEMPPLPSPRAIVGPVNLGLTRAAP